MSLINFVREEELRDFVYGVIGQYDREFSDSTVEDVTNSLRKIKETYDRMVEEYDSDMPGSYIATCLVVYMMAAFEAEDAVIDITPKD